LIFSHKGLGPQLNGSEDIKTDLFQEEDPLLVEKAMLPTGVFAVHVYGCENLDLNFPPELFGFYVEITVGSMTKCTSTQSPFKNGRVVWDEIKNFSLTISPKITSSINKVTFAVVGFDKLQPKTKHKLLGKTEFHLHKLAKKQWSMETFQLLNRKKQHTGDLQLEIAFAYGVYGYGLCDQDFVCTQEGTTPKYHYFQGENYQLGTGIQPILF